MELVYNRCLGALDHLRQTIRWSDAATRWRPTGRLAAADPAEDPDPARAALIAGATLTTRFPSAVAGRH